MRRISTYGNCVSSFLLYFWCYLDAWRISMPLRKGTSDKLLGRWDCTKAFIRSATGRARALCMEVDRSAETETFAVITDIASWRQHIYHGHIHISAHTYPLTHILTTAGLATILVFPGLGLAMVGIFLRRLTLRYPRLAENLRIWRVPAHRHHKYKSLHPARRVARPASRHSRRTRH